MNRSDRNAAVVAVLVVIAVTLHSPTWASLRQNMEPGTRANRETKDIRVIAKKYEYDPQSSR